MDINILRVFPRRTKGTPVDELAVIGEPDLLTDLLDFREIHISVTFTGDLPEAERLAGIWAQRFPGVSLKASGPALGERGEEFTPGLYLRDGYTITSRGCPRSCPFCYVPGREGPIRELEIKPGHIIQDNNLLACSVEHFDGVIEMLRSQRYIQFPGGLDARLLRDHHAQQLRSLRGLQQLFLAWDLPHDEEPVLEALQTLQRAGLRHKQLRVYVLAGFLPKDTPAAAHIRCMKTAMAGGIPFMMLYQGDEPREYSREWRRMQKLWARPASIYRYLKSDEAQGLKEDLK